MDEDSPSSHFKMLNTRETGVVTTAFFKESHVLKNLKLVVFQQIAAQLLICDHLYFHMSMYTVLYI